MRHPRISIATVTAVMLAAVSAAASDVPVAVARAESAGVHRFDFDERAEGNVEDVPKYWFPFRPAEFPRFARGTFDADVGRTAPPSFRLNSEGRNVAYAYQGPATRVRRNISYRIDGFAKPSQLVHARACLSAHYLDKFGNVIPGTLVRSSYVGGSAMPAEWQPIGVQLGAAPADAHTIGLIVWLMQQPTWDLDFVKGKDIAAYDIHASVWFDDLTVESMPRLELSTNSPANVLASGQPGEVTALYMTGDPAAPPGRLSIRSATGVVVLEERIHPTPDEFAEPQRIAVTRLPPGLYTAKIEIRSQRDDSLTQTLTFAILAQTAEANSEGTRPFGIVLSADVRSDSGSELALLELQGVESVKVPLWARHLDAAATIAGARGTDRPLHELSKRNFSLIGVLTNAPKSSTDAAGRQPSLLEVLAGEPNQWQEHLATVVAPNAGVFRGWQIGPDGPTEFAPPQLVDRAVSQIRQAMRRFITSPSLALPSSSAVEPDDSTRSVEHVSIALANETNPTTFERIITGLKKRAYPRVSAFVAPLPADRFQRLPRLAEWAQRVIAARHAGADVVYVPQTWQVRQAPWGTISEPTEEFILLRTIGDMLADAAPAQEFPIAPGVQCLVFRDRGASVMAMWDEQADLDGRVHAVQLGRATKMVDLWGRESDLSRDERGRHLVRLTPSPVFVRGTEDWLVEFATSSLTIEPGHVESGTELARHTLHIDYRGSRPLTGTIQLKTPDTWEVAPRETTFTLQPNQKQTRSLEVRYPHNEPAELKRLMAHVTLAETGYYLEVPLALTVGLTNVDVWGTAVVDGDMLLLRHVVTNRTTRSLNFRGTINVPERERQYRPFSNLAPGETQAVDYRVHGGQALVGAKIRLTLSEMNDGPRSHTLELTVP